MKSILIISPVPTHPVAEGNTQRVHDLCVNLRAMGYNPFFVYCPVWGFPIPDDLGAFRSFWGERCKVIPKVSMSSHEFRPSMRQSILTVFSAVERKLGRPRWFRPISSLIRLLLINQDTYCPRELSKWAREFCEREAPVAVISEYYLFSQILDVIPGSVQKIVDTHDVFTQRNERLRKTLGRNYYWHSLTDAQERRALSRADVVLAIQSEEAKHFRQRLDSKCRVAVVDFLAPIEASLKCSSRGKTLGFIASKNILNRNGFEWFLANCWGRIRAAVPDARLVLAGSICGTIQDDSIEMLGIVPETSDFFSKIDLFVNSILTGTGLKIKVVEAMRHGVAVVSTSVGAEGFEDAAPHALRIAGDADEMVEMCVRLLENEDELKQLGQNSLECYSERLETSLRELNRSIEA